MKHKFSALKCKPTKPKLIQLNFLQQPSSDIDYLMVVWKFGISRFMLLSKNRVNRGYLIGEENRIEIYTVVNLKIAEIETVEIKECLYM